MNYLYKKKNLKFDKSKEIKKDNLLSLREANKQKRLSILRDIDFKDSKENFEDELEEKKKCIPTRMEMLKKWKQEKSVRQNQPGKCLVKPQFGLKKQTATFLNKTEDSKIKVQNASNNDVRTGTQNTKLIPKRSTFLPQKLTGPVSKSTVPVSKSVSTNTTSQITQRSVASKSVLTAKPSVQNSKLTALSSRTSSLQEKTVPKGTKPNVKKVPGELKVPTKISSQPSKGAHPITNSRIASKITSSLPKVSQKLPLTKSKLEKDIKNTNVLTNNKPSKPAFPKKINDPNKLLYKRNQITKNRPADAEIKELKVKKAEREEIFTCDISRIVPSLSRKSFAPENFMFCPPSEWSFAFQVDVSSPASVLKLKSNRVQRTSSPLKLDVKSPVDESPEKSLDCNLPDRTSLNEKTRTSPDDNECQRNLTNMKVGIPEINGSNSSHSDSTTVLGPKIPLKTTTDISTNHEGNLLEKVTDDNGVLNVKPSLLDNDMGKFQQKVTGEKARLNAEPTMPAAFDSITSEITKDCSKTCTNSLKETLNQDDSLKTVNCVTSEMLDDKKLITFELVDVMSSHEHASNCASETLLPVESCSQIFTKNCSGSSFTSEPDATSKIEGIRLVNLVSAEAKLSKSIDSDACENKGEESVMPICNNTDNLHFCVASPHQDKSLDKINCLAPSMSEGIKPVKTFDISSDKTSENCLNKLIDIDNHVQQCPTTLSESLKSFSVVTSVAEKVSGKKSIGHRKSKMSLRYALESINESIEGKDTPYATPMSVKKVIVEDSFTPRRSPRLAEKLNRSGSFESILNVEEPEIINFLDLDDVKANVPDSVAEEVNKTSLNVEDNAFTPRRSKRLSEMLRRSNSFENLFNVRRPSIMGSPCTGKGYASGLTYDFNNLFLEDSPKVRKSTKGRAAQTSRKASLLYTPPTRKSTLRQSIRGDLMSFSPS